MYEMILTEIGISEVYLCIMSIIIDDQQIGNEGLQFLCFQKLSHVT
jgi:hypothetical protein